MKRSLVKVCLCLLICALTLSSFTACYERTQDPEDFENLYASQYASAPNMLSFSSYAYHSYLLLFPRTAPKELKDFVSVFRPAFGCDRHLFYFSYSLDALSYAKITAQMVDFSITSDRGTNRVIYDNDGFSYPAVILSFPGKDGAKQAPFEYLLLDDENCTVISVYSMNFKDGEVKENLPEAYWPNDIESLRASLAPLANAEGNFSLYRFTGEDGADTALPLGDLRYVDLFHTEGIDW